MDRRDAALSRLHSPHSPTTRSHSPRPVTPLDGRAGSSPASPAKTKLERCFQDAGLAGLLLRLPGHSLRSAQRKVSGLEPGGRFTPLSLSQHPLGPAGCRILNVLSQIKGDESTFKIPHPAGSSPVLQSSQLQVAAVPAVSLPSLLSAGYISSAFLACVRLSSPVHSGPSVVAALLVAVVSFLGCVWSSPSSGSSFRP